MTFPVFDLHCDTSYARLGRSFDRNDSLVENDLHIDLTRAKKFPAYAQCFGCFTSPLDVLPDWLTPERLFAMEYGGILEEISLCDQKIRLATTGQEVRDNADLGLASAVLTIEGTAGFGYDPDMLESLYHVGFRITTLGWNEQNCLCGSHATGGGLTDRGIEYVRRAQCLGMLIDVSHISDEAFYDILDITDGPLIATHSNCRALQPISRNLTEEMFCAICETGGLAGVNLYVPFLGDDADVDRVCDHIFHYLSLDPSGKHIALGGDLDGCDQLPAGIAGIQDYDKISQRLLDRGLEAETVMDIFWNNGLGVMDHAICQQQK